MLLFHTHTPIDLALDVGTSRVYASKRNLNRSNTLALNPSLLFVDVFMLCCPSALSTGIFLRVQATLPSFRTQISRSFASAVFCAAFHFELCNTLLPIDAHCAEVALLWDASPAEKAYRSDSCGLKNTLTGQTKEGVDSYS